MNRTTGFGWLWITAGCLLLGAACYVGLQQRPYHRFHQHGDNTGHEHSHRHDGNQDHDHQHFGMATPIVHTHHHVHQHQHESTGGPDWPGAVRFGHIHAGDQIIEYWGRCWMEGSDLLLGIERVDRGGNRSRIELPESLSGRLVYGNEELGGVNFVADGSLLRATLPNKTNIHTPLLTVVIDQFKIGDESFSFKGPVLIDAP